LEIGFQFEGKDSKGLSDDLGDQILESIRELELRLRILGCPALLELLGYVLDAIEQELGLLVLGLKEVDNIRNAN
jgi:hypothetical protein